MAVDARDKNGEISGKQHGNTFIHALFAATVKEFKGDPE
jgi:hypothetical protein